MGVGKGLTLQSWLDEAGLQFRDPSTSAETKDLQPRCLAAAHPFFLSVLPFGLLACLADWFVISMYEFLPELESMQTAAMML